MRKLLVTTVAALAFLVPSSAHAVVFLGVRAGYALPSGDAVKSVPMKDQLSANVPVQIDAGMSVLGILNLGLYGSYGPTTLSSTYKASYSDAKGTNLRVGVQGFLRAPVFSSLWGGAFAGLEQQQLSGSGLDVKLRGWEAGLQAGYDFSVLPFIKVGPYASYSVGQFQVASVSSGSYGISGPIPDKGTHSALSFGLRGLFDL